MELTLVVDFKIKFVKKRVFRITITYKCLIHQFFKCDFVIYHQIYLATTNISSFTVVQA